MVAVELREPFRGLLRVWVVQDGETAASPDLAQLIVQHRAGFAARWRHAITAEERIDVIGASQFGALDPEHSEIRR